jgi:hypothetical protein
MTDSTNQEPTTPPPPAPGEGSWGGVPSGATPPPPPTDVTGQTPAPASSSVSISVDNPLGLVLGIVAVIGVVLGLLVKSDGVKLWDTMGWTWAVLAIVAAVAVLVLSLSGLVPVSRAAAARLMAISAGVLVLWWVLFVLPIVSSNTSFLATVGTLAAVGAAYVGRDTTA